MRISAWASLPIALTAGTAWARHPNYFGEWLFWLGLWLAGGAESLGVGWSALGPLTMTALFLGVSIGLMETRQATRKGYVC